MSSLSLKELYEQGRHTEVVALASKADIHPARDPANSFIVAASLLQLGHAPQCRQVCEALASVLANNPLFLSLYATCLRRLGELEKSAEIFLQALKQFPDLPYLNNNYANLLVEKGELDAAQQILSATVKRHPTYADAAANLQRIRGQAALPGQPASLPGAQPASAQRSTSQLNPGKDQTQPSPAKSQAPEPVATETAAKLSAGVAAAIEPTGPSKPLAAIVDPLDLAFSEEELELEQRARRERKAAVEAQAAKGGANQAEPAWVSLPAVPSKELQEELVKAGVEALIEKQPEAALMLADLLNSLGTEGRRDALTIAADAYLMLKRFSQAEITLLQLATSGARLSGDQLLNLASLAINRQDPILGGHYLEQARKQDATPQQLESVSNLLNKLNNGKPRLIFHPYQQATSK